MRNKCTLEIKSHFLCFHIPSREPKNPETTTVSHKPSEPSSLALNGACCGDVELRLPMETSSLTHLIGSVMIIDSGAAAT